MATYGPAHQVTTMRAYHGDPDVKAKYVARMRSHQEADELIHGQYWEGGKGCAIGCTVHSNDHGAYETELGMPKWFAYLEDAIFEGMSVEASCRFPLRLLSAVPVGFAAWNCLYHEFCAYVLRDICMFDRTKYPDVASAVDAVIYLHERWTETDDQAWMVAQSAAYSAAQSAAYSAARSADSATRSVDSMAWAARSAARSARSAAWAARSADSAAWAARSAARSTVSESYDRMGDWLIDYFGGLEADATDDDAEPGGNREQRCSRYPDNSSQATIVEAGA